jgi:hypothetical protein
MLNFIALDWPHDFIKKIATNLGSQFTTFGANVLAFINKLGQKNKPKMLKVGPKFFCHDS